MLNNIVIGRYFSANSSVHKMNPFFKLLCLILYILTLFLIDDLLLLLVMTLFLVLIIGLTHIPIKLYLKSIYGLRYLVISFLLINLFMKIPATESILSVSRIVLIVLYSTLLSLTTKPLDLMNAVEILFTPLSIIKVPIKQFSFILVNAIRFIPIVIDNTNDLLKSQYTYLSKSTNIKENFLSVINVLVPIFINSINSLDGIIVSLELKLYDFNNITKKNFKVSGFDSYLLFLHIALFVLVGGVL